jgi:hypothetical protein
VGLPLLPPEQVWNALQLRSSSAQSKTCPQLLMARPQAQPSSAQLLAFGTQGSSSGESHWNGSSKLQKVPLVHVPQLKAFTKSVPQPSNAVPHSLPLHACA